MIEFGSLTDITRNRKALRYSDGLFFVFSQEDTKEYVLYLNRIEQIFEKGETVAGDLLGLYSVTTEIISQGESFFADGQSKQKVAGEPYFLVDSGQLFDSFTVQAGENDLTIDAYTIKEGEDLEDKFGEFVGLNNESIGKLAEYIIQGIQEWILRTLLS